MPSSLRRRAAHLRASYTGETHPLATPGIARHDVGISYAGNGLGLDACTAQQRQLRALLALGLLNHGPTSAWPRHVSLADVTRYTLVVSPRYNDLVITTRAPYNVACWLVGRDKLPEIGVPGLRVESSHAEGWRLRHLPTGAALTVTRNRHGHLQGPVTLGSNYTRLWTTDVPLTAEEHAVLNALPPLCADTETLLAALTVRLCTHAPDGSWDIGTWFSNLTGRPSRAHSHHRRLSVEAGQCTLHWDSNPHPEDLYAALTDPVIGLPGTIGLGIRMSNERHRDGSVWWVIQLLNDEVSVPASAEPRTWAIPARAKLTRTWTSKQQAGGAGPVRGALKVAEEATAQGRWVRIHTLLHSRYDVDFEGNGTSEFVVDVFDAPIPLEHRGE
ncbi:hypothetical protein [Streptomyces sp. NPDC013740]|uniref:hypothetical protein n=1 Tax=Streptomyces sp. NPDC013740 TaxID=3364867 RepID=UPI0036FF2F61